VSVWDRVEYAAALSSLAELASAPRLALAASDGTLVSRVRRLLGDTPAAPSSPSAWLSGVAVVGLVSVIPVATVAVQDRGAAEPTVIQAVPPTSGHTASSPSVAGDPARRAASRAPVRLQPGVSQSAPAVLTQEDATHDETAASLRARLDASARHLQAIAEECLALERATIQEQSRLVRSELEARVSRLREALQETKTRFEIGLANVSSVRDLEVMVAEAENRVAKLDLETKAQEAASDISRRETTLQMAYENLRTRLDAATQARANQAGQPAAERSVIAGMRGTERIWLEPREAPYVQDGPVVELRVDESEAATTADGQPISRVRFIGWREGSATRVMVFVSVPRDEVGAYTTDASRLAERDAGTYLVQFGQLLELADLEALGVRNVSIGSVARIR
jgi:hypothetical protein